jgi:hypothetical protein
MRETEYSSRRVQFTQNEWVLEIVGSAPRAEGVHKCIEIVTKTGEKHARSEIWDV